jgi:S-adenosyl-L-methionine hydrolase (adenosine-forming)
MRPCVALLSDFGSHDVYVGVMKGVVARIAPEASLIDLTHEIPPADVRQGAFRLWQALPFMPRGTVFLAVVDPGVGTSRRPLAVRCDEFSCVGPDNGIFTYLLEGRRDARAVQIERVDSLADLGARARSSTFHGRDVFAPAAGLIAAGMEVARLGSPAADPVTVPWPRLSCEEPQRLLRGETLFADRYGNMVTSIGLLARDGDTLRLDPWVPGCPSLALAASQLSIQVGSGLPLPLARTFAEVPPGRALAFIGSDNLLEIGVNRGSAVDSLNLVPGTDVILRWR